ncbi:transcriptional repressor LexA [Clostridium cylindrosporum]|uniref:LexA repressor n=1 Tax=Clostridium cylindrosporum DSM 605 TaxID=1121307 RepID=A0A0J8DB31_CLOCY|nr:transcriptional repressor LexA [Clostridium cylindrosporum]KMT23037.1 SOS regulatory protein LexA [Clostridium cylindrosporum DSM 605]
MLTIDLTDKQEKVLEYIRKEVYSKGYPPSVREICSALGFKSTSTVHAHLTALEKKGAIRKDPTKPRAIEIIEDSKMRREIVSVPIVGEVAAGEPILAIENVIDTFPIPLDYIKSNNKLFMLEVKGESMIEAGINNGDYLIFETSLTANNGDIVVALIEDSATVKRFYKKEDYFVLRPENASMDDIIVKECSILGKAVGLFRSMK